MQSVTAVLSATQLATLAEHGEERTADVGDVLFKVGDTRYPLIAIREGEVAVLDAAGNEIVRHGASGFLGEINLLSGQTVYLTAVATKPMRYIAVERELRVAGVKPHAHAVHGHQLNGDHHGEPPHHGHHGHDERVGIAPPV